MFKSDIKIKIFYCTKFILIYLYSSKIFYSIKLKIQ